MKTLLHRSLITLLLATATLAHAGRYTVSWPSGNGWFNPTGNSSTVTTATEYDFNSSIYRTNHGTSHAGTDLIQSVNTPVRAIADGVVALVWDSTAESSAVLVRHQSTGGGFYAVYGHLRPAVRVGDRVTAGITTVGTLLTFSSPTHLHFGINTSSTTSFISGSYGWGRIPSAANPPNSGWVDALTYLRQYRSVPAVSPPTNLYPTPTSSNVRFSWASVSGANGYRVHVSTSLNGWSPTTGWDAYESRQPTSNVPVNVGVTGSNYTWESGSAGSMFAPQPRTTYYVSVRVNTATQGASNFTPPVAFTMPNAAASTPALSLSTTSISRSVTQYSSASPSTFTVRNSASGTLSYSAWSNQSWMSVSPSSGTSTGESDSLTVTFNTSGYSPQTLNGSVTINGGSAGSQTLYVSLTITGTPSVSDDHGNFTWNASTMYRWNTHAGRLETGGDKDVFRLLVTSSGNYTFSSTSSIDTWADLLDSNGAVLQSDDDNGEGLNFFLTRYLQPGTYYLSVRGYSSSTTGAYSVIAQ
jgi:hypothetical protein